MGKRLLKSGILTLIASTMLTQYVHGAQCEYNVINDWGSGFQAEIRIVNNDTTPINGWAVEWLYGDGSEISGQWNATFSGENPYSATALSWNAVVEPGEFVAFGFTGVNGSDTASIPTVTGEVCGAMSSSSSVSSSSVSSIESSSSIVPSSSSIASSSSSAGSSVVSSSVASSSVASSSIGGSSSSVAAGNALWQLDSGLSQLNFSTTKNIHVVENMSFTQLSGEIDDNGNATLSIALGSIQSGVDIRNQRMQNILFETASFPIASIELSIDLDAINAISVGSTTTIAVSAALDLHGVEADVNADLIVSRLSASRIMVQNAAPILIIADDFNLDGGVEQLQTVANLNSIGKVVPVDFTLFYNTL